MADSEEARKDVKENDSQGGERAEEPAKLVEDSIGSSSAPGQFKKENERVSAALEKTINSSGGNLAFMREFAITDVEPGKSGPVKTKGLDSDSKAQKAEGKLVDQEYRADAARQSKEFGPVDRDLFHEKDHFKGAADEKARDQWFFDSSKDGSRTRSLSGQISMDFDLSRDKGSQLDGGGEAAGRGDSGGSGGSGTDQSQVPEREHSGSLYNSLGNGTYLQETTVTTTSPQTPDAAPLTPERQKELELKADALRKASHGLGTDEEAIFKTLEGLNAADRKALNDIYKSKHGETVDEMLKSEMSGEDLKHGMRLLNRTDVPAPEGISREAVEGTVNKINELGKDFLTRNPAEIAKLLEGKSDAEKAAINDTFREKFGKSLPEFFKEKLSGDDAQRLTRQLTSQSSPAGEKAFASKEQLERIHGQVDTDKDGQLSKEELEKAVKSGVLRGEDQKVGQLLLDNFEKMKGLSDDQILWETKLSKADLGKFQEMQLKEKQDHDYREDLKAWGRNNFKGADKDNDGFLSRQELADAAKASTNPREKLMLERAAAEFDDIKKANSEFSFSVQGVKDWMKDGISQKDITEYVKEGEQKSNYDLIRPLDKQYEHEKLRDSINNDPRFTEEERAKFRQDMEALEKRARERGLSDDEVTKTYREIGKLLDAKGDKPISADDRALLAKQVMDQAAHPTTIDQGYHNTCNVTSIESNLYTHTPSEMARLVADVGTTGKYVAGDGTTIEMRPKDFVKDTEAGRVPPNDGDRTYASQLANLTMVNIKYQKQSPHLRYENAPLNLSAGGSDTGERIVDYSKNPPEEVKNADGTPKAEPGVNTADMGMIMDTVRGGKTDRDSILHFWEHGNGTKDRDSGNTYLANEKMLQDKLAQMKAEGSLPGIIVMHTGAAPWLNPDGGTVGGDGGWHVVNVTDYDPGPPARVQIDNQWGENRDRTAPDKAITVTELYRSMQGPEKYYQALEEEAKQARARGEVDTGKELDIAAYKLKEKKLTPEEYAKELAKIAKDTDAEWKKDHAAGKLDINQVMREQRLLTDALNKIEDPALKMQVYKEIAGTELLPAGAQEFLVENAAFDAITKKQDLEKAGKFDEQAKKNFEQFQKDLKETLDKLPEEVRKRIMESVKARLNPPPPPPPPPPDQMPGPGGPMGGMMGGIFGGQTSNQQQSRSESRERAGKKGK